MPKEDTNIICIRTQIDLSILYFTIIAQHPSRLSPRVLYLVDRYHNSKSCGAMIRYDSVLCSPVVVDIHKNDLSSQVLFHKNHRRLKEKTILNTSATSSISSLATLLITVTITLTLISTNHVAQAVTDSKSHLVKETTVIMIENDGNTPINYHLVDCDERNGHSRLSHIVAKLSNEPMPVSKTDDGKWWRIDLSSKPIEPGIKVPLQVTKVYTHLELVPDHDVYLIPYSSIQYQVRIVKQGRPQKIKVPSERYYLVIDDRELVDLDETTSTAYALDTEGSTKIRFVDKSVISDEDFIQPESSIHIVQPSYMTMHITPGDDSWDLKKFTDYAIEIRIFDAQQHRIYPSDNLNIQLTSGNELVITNSTSNGTFHNIHTLNTGPSKLVAHLFGTTGSTSLFDRSQSLDVELVQELQIHEPLEVRPTAVVLPWLPESKPSYQLSIFAAGGTGSYVWSTTNTVLSSITYGGDDSSVAKITTTGEGNAFISCTDTKSSVFSKHSLLVVAKPIELNILPSITETELDGDILLPVAVYANNTSLLQKHLPEDERESNLVLFHDCSKIKFDVDIVEKSRFTYDSSEILPSVRPKSCASLKFTCTQPGSSRVWISYTNPTDPMEQTIKSTTIIACYKPLRPVYPVDTGVLALHTSMELAFEGGPRPFGSRLEDHYAYLEPNDDPIVKIEPVIDRYRFNKDLHVFKVHCNQYGEVPLTLSVGNQPSSILPNPASSKSSVRIICAKPESIQLKPRLKDSCPLNEMANLLETLVPVSNASPTDFEMLVFDESKRQFLNISSFSIDWTLKGHGFISSKSMVEEVNAVAGFRRVTRNYITIQPSGREGLGKLQANLRSYKSQGPYRGQTLDLASNLDIQFVDFAQISPNRTVLYNHKKNVVVLSILKGSGYFSVESLQGAKHANVTYVSVFGHHRINITPLSVGKFIIRLEDQCLESSLGTPMLSEVSVVSDVEFSKEVSKPGRSLKYCRDVDESMFCVYLSVERAHIPSTTQAPTPVPPPPPPREAVAPVIEQPRVTIASSIHQKTQQQTTLKPAVIAPLDAIRQDILQPSTTPSPKVSFVDSSSKRADEDQNKTSLLQRIFAYLMVLVSTAAAITLGYKWWQDKNKKAPQGSIPYAAAESSFLRQSPNSSARFSPSPSLARGPSSSTPRARPLYTERFSTTLLSD